MKPGKLTTKGTKIIGGGDRGLNWMCGMQQKAGGKGRKWTRGVDKGVKGHGGATYGKRTKTVYSTKEGGRL